MLNAPERNRFLRLPSYYSKVHDASSRQTCLDEASAANQALLHTDHFAALDNDDRCFADRVPIAVDRVGTGQWRLRVLQLRPAIADRRAIGRKVLSGDAVLADTFTRQIKCVVR